MTVRPIVRPMSVALVLALVLVVTACSIEETLPSPGCEEDGSSLIVAQSVPTGELVPCLHQLPEGWEISTINIDQDGTVIQLDSDRAGSGAADLRYEKSCDPGAAVSVPSDQNGVATFDYIDRIEPGFRAQRYYVFPGGCVWWSFDFDDDASTALSIELDNSMSLVSRDWINEQIRSTFIDEEL